MEKLWEYLIRIGGKVNMKRFFAFAMVLIFLSSVLAGCDKNNSKESNINWAIPDEIKNIQVSYSPVKYKAEVPHYDILKGLGNIENIAQFSGFSDDQKSMIEENGFVVLPGKQTKMNYLYDSNEYLGIPNFVTSDVVLHLYHQFYEKSLFYVENEYLAKDLEQLTDRMFDKSVIVFEQINDNKLKDINELNSRYALDNLKHQFVAKLQTKFLKYFTNELVYRYNDRMNLGSYNLLDEKLSFNKKDFSVYVLINNVTDSDYSETFGVPMPQRWFHIGFSYNINIK